MLMSKVMYDLNEKFDIIIDDGLHSPTANISMFSSTFDYLDYSGCYVIEDVRRESLGILLAGIMSRGLNLNIKVIKCNYLYLVCVNKVLK
jgi:hypothetical protein